MAFIGSPRFGKVLGLAQRTVVHNWGRGFGADDVIMNIELWSIYYKYNYREPNRNSLGNTFGPTMLQGLGFRVGTARSSEVLSASGL